MAASPATLTGRMAGAAPAGGPAAAEEAFPPPVPWNTGGVDLGRSIRCSSAAACA